MDLSSLLTPFDLGRVRLACVYKGRPSWVIAYDDESGMTRTSRMGLAIGCGSGGLVSDVEVDCCARLAWSW